MARNSSGNIASAERKFMMKEMEKMIRSAKQENEEKFNLVGNKLLAMQKLLDEEKNTRVQEQEKSAHTLHIIATKVARMQEVLVNQFKDLNETLTQGDARGNLEVHPNVQGPGNEPGFANGANRGRRGRSQFAPVGAVQGGNGNYVGAKSTRAYKQERVPCLYCWREYSKGYINRHVRESHVQQP